MSRAFINFVKKDALSTCLRELGLSDDGNLDELRSRLRAYMDKDEIPREHEIFIQKLRLSYDPTCSSKDLNVPSTQPSRSSSPANIHEEILPNLNNEPDICDKIRKWGVKYDGGKDPLCFLERIEELATCYSLTRNTLLKFMPELLKGEALSWYRNNHRSWRSFEDFVEDFKLFFLPVRFFESLDDQIRNRLQHPEESFTDYVTGLQTLMRWANLSTDEQLERIFRNCRSEYKLYIKRRDFSKLRELIILAQEFESIQPREGQQKKPTRLVQTVVAGASKPKICYRCGEKGHQRITCTNPQIIFCWDCGKKNVRTVDCCRFDSGNKHRGPSGGEGEVDL